MAALQTLLLRKACERGVTRTNWLTSYHTFSFGDYMDPQHHHFGVLRVLNDDTVLPGKGFSPHQHRDMEIITLVLSGQLAHKDNLGNGSIINVGDIQVMSAGTGIEHSEFNASQATPVHFLQIWVFPEKKGIPPRYQQQQAIDFTVLNQWQWLIGPDSRTGCERPGVAINQQASLVFAVVDAFKAMTFKPAQGRVWLHVIKGGFTIDGIDLNPGDGVGLSPCHQVTVTSTQANSQLLLFDLPAD
jgi:quercetin 2,3-dioxygenase